jgi:hypothetical protein
MTDIRSNNLPAAIVAEAAVRLIEAAGGTNDDWPFIITRADRGWCAGEIARSYVRVHFQKSDIRRRRLLTKLTKLGARS